MSTINEALKELRESYSDLPEDLDFENVEFFQDMKEKMKL